MPEMPGFSCCTPAGGRVQVCNTSAVSKASHIVNHWLVDLRDPEFLMGDAFNEGYAGDGEGPQRKVKCHSFRIGVFAVSNDEFTQFVKDTGYKTDAERYGWSFVFYDFIPPEGRSDLRLPIDMPWWLQVEGACWAAPEGPGSDITSRMNHPVTHVSWFDAKAYCRWSNTRLPTEAEWEYAARGGMAGKRYAWGDDLKPDGKHRCNIWQGAFPSHNTGADGYLATAPVDAFEPNGYGLYNVCGNVWEWCEDWFTTSYHRTTSSFNPIGATPQASRSIRGGSFLCHHSYCNRYRVAARSFNSPDSTTSHCGFRVVVDY